MARQLSFDLPPRVSLGPEDYFVAPANETAYRMVMGEAPWPEGKLALVGPEGAGKTHLARVWAARAGATVLPAAALDPGGPPEIAPGAAIVLEDVERLPESAEEAAFHLHNRLRAAGGRLLLTGRVPPRDWPIRLPDLASRFRATALARLGDPCDLLLSAVLLKQFADRQISPGADLVPYLARRIERSFAAAAGIVEALDRASLETGRPVGRRLAADLLDNAA